MDAVQPLWQASLRAAKRDAFAALPPSEEEAAKAASEAHRTGSRARKRGMRGLARQVFKMHDQGLTADEIGKAVDRSPRAACTSAKRPKRGPSNDR